jgi:DNA replication protein DnaC
MAECDPELETLHADLAAKRKAAASDHAELLGDILHRRTLAEISATMPPLTAEQIAARDAEQRDREAQREHYARHDRWRGLVKDRGERYGDCRLSNFAADTDSQKKSIADLTDYCGEITDRIADGEGLILYGPKGTGKDHLAMAVARVAILAGKHVLWQNGMDLFGDIRDGMDNGDSERALVKRLVSPDVLYLSDPVPPIGSLSEFQSTMMFRILDGRYSRRRPTWCTVNVESGVKLDERMGAQNGDRLRDGALAIFCDWPSHRMVRQ